MNIPEIRIQSSMLIFESISMDERKLWSNKFHQESMSFAEIKDYTIQLQTAWDKYGKSVLLAMCELYGVEFKKNIIDVYVTQWNGSISNPLILNPSRPPEIQIETIMHELLHILFTDNTSFSMHDRNQDHKIIDDWRSLFGGDLEWKTLVHIPVHAGLKALFLDVLDEPRRLERDKLRHEHNPVYNKSWEYVESNNHRNINAQLKKLYENHANKF
jgi:hypothetical protein